MTRPMGCRRGGAAVDQDGQVTGGNRFHRDHGATRGQGRRQGGGVTAEEHPPSHERLDGGLDAELWVVGIVCHEDHVRPGPRSGGGACGTPERRRLLAQYRQDVPRLERDEPGSVGVVADGDHDGEERGALVVPRERIVAHTPCRAVLQPDEAFGGLARVGLAEREGDTGGRDTDCSNPWAGASTLQSQPPAAQLAASNEWRAGVSAKRSSNVAASSAPSDGCRIGSPDEPIAQPAPPPGAAGEGGAGHRTEAEGKQFGQVSWWFRVRRCSGRAPGHVGLRRKAEAPSLAELVRVHEARPATDVAPEVERGERRPVGAVAEHIVCDAPERVARPYRVGPGR